MNARKKDGTWAQDCVHQMQMTYAGSAADNAWKAGTLMPEVQDWQKEQRTLVQRCAGGDLQPAGAAAAGEAHAPYTALFGKGGRFEGSGSARCAVIFHFVDHLNSVAISVAASLLQPMLVSG